MFDVCACANRLGFANVKGRLSWSWIWNFSDWQSLGDALLHSLSLLFFVLPKTQYVRRRRCGLGTRSERIERSMTG